jgi:hypothetical protein
MLDAASLLSLFSLLISAMALAACWYSSALRRKLSSDGIILFMVAPLALVLGSDPAS